MNSILEIPEIAGLDARRGLVRIPPELDVPLTDRVRQIIDTAEFRRLAKISQLGLVSLVLVAAVLGDRLRARYLVSSSLGWLLLCGVSTVPLRHRTFLPPKLMDIARRTSFLETLPLSIVMTLFVVASFRFWEAMNLIRVEEEGAASPREWMSGWTASLHPLDDYADASICGALELERWAKDFERSLPLDGVVAMVPLRDGRGWTLRGPLARTRPDLVFVELEGSCCPLAPDVCAARIPDALAHHGGVLVVPLAPEGRCQSGAVSADADPLREALLPLVEERALWYGIRRFATASGSTSAPVCEILGGQSPQPPAR